MHIGMRRSGKRAGLILFCFILAFLSQVTLTPASRGQATASCDLYQLHRNKTLWQYNGSTWYQVDGNPGTWYIVARGAYLYQMHTDHSIWQYTGGCGYSASWAELDNNSLSIGLAVGIQGQVYQYRTDNSIWMYTGPTTGVGGFHQWKEIDNNSATTMIAAGSAGGLFQVRVTANGWHVWQYSSSSIGGTGSWTEITNPNPPALQPNPDPYQLTTNGYTDQYLTLYEKDSSGDVWKYAGGGASGWTEIFTSPSFAYAAGAAQIAASNHAVYQMHGDGSIWQYTSGTSWTEIDANSATIDIETGLNGTLYQLQKTGAIYKYDGGGFGNWTEIDTNPTTAYLATPEYM